MPPGRATRLLLSVRDDTACSLPHMPKPPVAGWRIRHSRAISAWGLVGGAPLPKGRQAASLTSCASRTTQPPATFYLRLPCNAKASACRSTPLERAPCDSAHVVARQIQLHGRHVAREGHCCERGSSWPHARGRHPISAWLERRPASAQAHAHQHRSTCSNKARAVQSQ